MKLKITLVLLLTLSPLSGVYHAFGDVVETRNGARLIGHITKITDGVIYLDTDYAGSLEIRQSEVVGFFTEQPVYVRLITDVTLLGQVSSKAEGKLQVSGEEGVVSTSMEKITASWQSGAEDPRLLQVKEEWAKKERRWKYEAAVDLAGKNGNSEEFASAIQLEATLVGLQDSLKFYGSYYGAEKDGDKTSDEIKGGIDYTTYFSEKRGWYGRIELEADEFEDLDLRATVASGFSYRFLNEEKHQLEGRVGPSFRHENFNNGSDKEAFGFDFGLFHLYQFEKWGKVTTELQYIPSLEDFSDYRFSHDTAFEVPLGLSDFWKLRLGVSNFFTSNPAPGREELDTTYYTRLVLEWE